MKEHSRCLIIGAGLTGLSAAYHLGKEYAIYEKEETPGGLCRTKRKDGFSFDYSGHLIHLRDGYAKMLVPSLLGSNLREYQRKAYIHFQSRRVPFPFQANLSILPEEINKECLIEFINSYCRRQQKGVESFEDWIVAFLGKGMAAHFFVPYNTKLYGTDLQEMTPEWCDLFVPKPSLEDVVNGAIGEQKKEFGYNATFLYPERGGIQSLVSGFVDNVSNLRMNTAIKKVLWKENLVIDVHGNIIGYENLISTMPLTNLLDSLEPTPDELSAAGSSLRYRSVQCLNIGLKREDQCDYHWAYFPGQDSVFYRVGFIHNFSPNSVPEECSAYYVEIATEPDCVIDEESLFKRAVKDLIRVNILTEADEIMVKCYLPIHCAYVVYNRERPAALKKIKRFLNENSIYSVGRYGEWKYSSMETAILDGKAIAEKLHE